MNLKAKRNGMRQKSFLCDTGIQNRSDLKTTIRLGFFCWYVLVEDGPRGITGVDFNEVEMLLHEVSEHGLNNYINNADFLWSFGYMISLFPYYFGEYEQWEAKGKKMLKMAHELFPDEPVYRYSYLASLPNTYGKHGDEFQRLHAVLDERFKGEGVLSRYFKSVWNHWHGD